MFTDLFNDDAFSLIALTGTINNVDHVPGRAGELVFAGISEGVSVTTASVEMKTDSLTLIQTSVRGGPSPKEGAPNKRTIKHFGIPHIKDEDSIQADSVQGVRAFGSTDQLEAVANVVNTKLAKMSARMDLTLENLRLGALKGIVKDADGSTIINLFTEFGITQDVYDLDLARTNSDPVDLRVYAQQIARAMTRKAKTVVPSSARVWALCGDNFFDALISRSDVKEVYKNTDEQRVRLGSQYTFGAFEYAGIVWENYRGTDDNSTVGIATDEAIGFLTGVPGLYAEYFAPADFMETVNTIGLPRYAKLAPDTKYNRFVEAHTQMNPLPLCMRPQTLVKFTK